jgi:hypothetical protein
MTDAAWACCMATNIYLSFSHRYDLDMLNALVKKYRLLSYGIPLVFGFLYLFVHTRRLGEVYGSAEVHIPLFLHFPSVTNTRADILLGLPPLSLPLVCALLCLGLHPQLRDHLHVRARLAAHLREA